MITSQTVSSEAQVKNFIYLQKNYVTKTQKFRYLENEALKIRRSTITIKAYFIAKNSLTVEVTFKSVWYNVTLIHF